MIAIWAVALFCSSSSKPLKPSRCSGERSVFRRSPGKCGFCRRSHCEGHVGLCNQLRHNIDEAVTSFLAVLEEQFTAFAKDCMASFNLKAQALVGFALRNRALDGALVGEVGEVIGQPASAFVGQQLGRRSKVSKPASFQGFNQTICALCLDAWMSEAAW